MAPPSTSSSVRLTAASRPACASASMACGSAVPASSRDSPTRVPPPTPVPVTWRAPARLAATTAVPDPALVTSAASTPASASPPRPIACTSCTWCSAHAPIAAGSRDRFPPVTATHASASIGTSPAASTSRTRASSGSPSCGSVQWRTAGPSPPAVRTTTSTLVEPKSIPATGRAPGGTGTVSGVTAPGGTASPWPAPPRRGGRGPP